MKSSTDGYSPIVALGRILGCCLSFTSVLGMILGRMLVMMLAMILGVPLDLC